MATLLKISKNVSEHGEQVALMDWVRNSYGRYPELQLLHAIPNGAKLPYFKNSKGQRVSPQALWLLSEGMLPGYPDLGMCVARRGYISLHIENKVGKNKLSEWQVEKIYLLRRHNNCVKVCYSMEEQKDVLEWYLGETEDEPRLRYDPDEEWFSLVEKVMETR